MVAIGNHEYGKKNCFFHSLIIVDYPEQPFKPSWMDYGVDSGGENGNVFQIVKINWKRYSIFETLFNAQ